MNKQTMNSSLKTFVFMKLVDMSNRMEAIGLCPFVNYFGHVSLISFQVCKSKKDYNKILYKKDFWLDLKDQKEVYNTVEEIESAINEILLGAKIEIH